MNVSDVLTMGLCSKYSRDDLIGLLGDGEFTYQDVMNASAPIEDRAVLLFTGFLSTEEKKTIIRTHANKISNNKFDVENINDVEIENKGDNMVYTALSNINTEDRIELLQILGKISAATLHYNKNAKEEVQALYQDIVQCLQSR
jgi:hypothetical protein